MALTTPAVVETDGGLIWQLFQPIGVTNQAGLDALVAAKILVADSWMRRRMGINYNLADADAQVMQAQGQSYLTLHYLVPILQACKVYGTNYPIWSEESASYDEIVQRDWKEEAISLLDEWITIEQIGAGRGFAKPVFLITDPTPILEDDTNGLTSVNQQLEEELARSRGFSVPDIGTVR